MDTPNELFYKPSILPPDKERDETPDSVIADQATASPPASPPVETDYSSLNTWNTNSRNPNDIYSADVPDPYLAYVSKFDNYIEIAKEIQTRASFLIDKTIEDLDSYVGDAPGNVIKLLEDLTDLSFRDSNGQPLSETDPVFTLHPDIVKCIYRVAGTYDPYREDKELIKDAKEFNGAGIQNKINKKITSKALQPLMLGLTLLTIVLKLSYVISIHYTIGWTCGFFKGKINIGINLKKIKFKKTWSIGNLIADIFKKVEIKLLWLNGWIGYSCNGRQLPAPNCGKEDWRKISFKSINCCSMTPIFFGPAAGDVNTPSSYIQSSCFEKYIRSELDPEYAGARTICSMSNANNTDMVPSDYEKAAAKEIAKYLNTRPSVSGTMGFGSENIATLSKSIDMAEVGIVMTETIQSSILANRDYTSTGTTTSNLNCFGLADPDSRSSEEKIASAVNNLAGTWLPASNGEPIIGNSYFEFLGVIDSTVAEMLKAADQAVSGIANLAKWGSSKQLCCYVYLLVAVASIWHSLVEKGVWCPDQSDGDAVRNAMHLRWAKELKESGDLQKLIALLQVIKQIVDIFIRKMQRQIGIAGLTLPLKEMWELIKVTIANGLSEYMDILLGPLDRILAGLQAIPEIRHMINNECFGFDKFLSFLMCLLGNLKWGIVNQIMKVFDFQLSDIVLIQDMLLTRMRLKSLEALSHLLGALINLILGLKDCYTADELINGLDNATVSMKNKSMSADTSLIGLIVAQEVNNEYAAVVNLSNLAGSSENLARFEEYSKPLIAESNTITPEQQTMLDTLQASISSQFGEFGPIAKEILDSAINAQSMDVSRFISNETGTVISYGEFVIMMEEMTGISVISIQESLRYIFDILRGNNETV